MSDYLTPEQEQAEEDAAISAAESREDEYRQAARLNLLALLSIAGEPTVTEWTWTPTRADAALLADWITELLHSHQAQADRITALLTAVDYLRPPF